VDAASISIGVEMDHLGNFKEIAKYTNKKKIKSCIYELKKHVLEVIVVGCKLSK